MERSAFYNFDKKTTFMHQNIKEKLFAFFVARRYLFSKKSHNTINIISAVSMCGVAVGTLALICVLSVLNGFEQLVKDSFSQFDPDLKITAKKGKVFDISPDAFQAIRQMENVAIFADVVEENALLCYDNKQLPVTIKGVSEQYNQMVDVESMIRDGSFNLAQDELFPSFIGLGVANALGTGVNYVSPLSLYLPKRTGTINIASPEKAFKREFLFVSGLFYSGQEAYDNKVVLLSLDLVRNLLDYHPDEATSVELKLKSGVNIKRTQRQIEDLLGEQFIVQNREEQQEDFYRIMKVEKWISFLILAFILLIAIFNIIGSLSMLMIDKKEDIEIYRRMGTPEKTIQHIFLYEGWLISITGAVIGLVFGLFLCYLQQYVGLLKMGTGFMVQNYPVQVQLFDVVAIFLTVILLGFFSAYYPVKSIGKK